MTMSRMSGSNSKESDAPESTAPLYVIKQTSDHTMLGSLYDYVAQKIHQDIRLKDWSTIIVRGDYSRDPPARLSDVEKSHKMFNWHRPTTTVLGPDTIAVNCFPGNDYVEHYASLVATFLALEGRDPGVVSCERPLANRCSELFFASNLRGMGQADVVVIGYAYRLQSTRGKEWLYSDDGEDLLFSWQKRTLPNGKTVAYLACMPSFWGDIGGHLVRALQHFSQVKCLLYLGKSGSLRPELTPNEWLVTGEKSYVGEELVTWQNVLGPEAAASETGLVTGTIVTVPSPLCESFDWLERWYPKSNRNGKACWVDCEVGHMARACREGNTDFGYLHIISDNVSRRCDENLANEFADAVATKRQRLFDQVETILEAFLARYGRGDTLNGDICALAVE